MANGAFSTTNPTGTIQQLQTVLNKVVIPKIKENLVYAGGLGGVRKDGDLGRNLGSLTMRSFKPRPAGKYVDANSATQIYAMTEGTPNTTQWSEFDCGQIEITLAQIGGKAKVTDIREMVQLINWTKQVNSGLVDDAVLNYDSIVQASIAYGPGSAAAGVASSRAMSGLCSVAAQNGSGFERFSGVPLTASSQADFNSLLGFGTNAAGKATRADFAIAATQLFENKVPQVGGRYVATIQHAVMNDLRQDPFLANAMSHGAMKNDISRNTIADVDGLNFVLHTNGWRELATYGTNDSTGKILSSFILGADAFMAPKLGGTNNPANPSITILATPDKMSDPHNQLKVLVWDALFNSACMLTTLTGDVPYHVQLRSRSTFFGA
jgi:hypothetical protein